MLIEDEIAKLKKHINTWNEVFDIIKIITKNIRIV